MVLSLAALEKLVTSDACYCSAPDDPDDMMIGICLKHLHISITHSPLFHQVSLLFSYHDTVYQYNTITIQYNADFYSAISRKRIGGAW